MMKIDVVSLAQQLISFQSVTPEDDGCIDFLISILEPLGFRCEKIIFENIINLYAKRGISKPNLCFAGHTDVVPPGDSSLWEFAPFEGAISNGKLYGRGAVDMKGAIAAFITAASEIEESEQECSISLLITGDEEAEAIYGTEKVLKYLEGKDEKIDFCIVGEPTSPKRLGEMIKIGRRGSVSFTMTINGKQGHVAQHEHANNPLTPSINILHALKHHEFDKGTDRFSPTNLEITSIDVGNKASNVIPKTAVTKFNIRFNDLHTPESLFKLVKDIVAEHSNSFILTIERPSQCSYSSSAELEDAITNATLEILDIMPIISSGGGTSDARFISHYCPVVEFGLLYETAHQIDEHAALEDLINLTKIYKKVIENFNHHLRI